MHVAITSRANSAYPRKRAVTACQVCRARRTKCDQKKPKCSFCEKTGAQCVSALPNESSFDPASLAIIERLERLERKLDASNERSTNHATNPASAPDPEQILPTHAGQPSSYLPQNLNNFLHWPIFQQYPSTVSAFSPISSYSHGATSHGGRSRTFALAGELSPAASKPWLDNFFSQVHIKNPVLDEDAARTLVRRICVEGPGWDAQSCLALLICANGALVRPFLDHSILSHDLEGSTAMALFTAAQKRFGSLCVTAGVVEAQCCLFSGTFLMSRMLPIDAWRMFLQGLSICQGFALDRVEEESTYWSCWKSEHELRWELGVASFHDIEPPRQFPSLPKGVEGHALRAWYFYLSEISLWRLETKARSEICQTSIEPLDKNILLDKLADLGDDTLDQLSSWEASLAPAVSLKDHQYEEDVLRFVLRGRITYVHELVSWPFLRLVIEESDPSPRALQWATKGLAFHLQRLLVNSTGFYHRHHGTWLMLRSSARSALIVLAFASSPTTSMLVPQEWRSLIDATLQMLSFWANEVEAFNSTVQLMQQMLEKIDSTT